MVQTFKYLLSCCIPSRKFLLHIILYIHLHAQVCRLKAAFHTIPLSLYLGVKLEAKFSTINLLSKHSDTCLHVSFHQEKSCCILYYIHLHASVCRLKAAFHTILLSPGPVREARSGTFDHKFTVQTFRYLLACFILPRKVLLHIILYINFQHVDLKQHLIQYYCHCTWEWSQKRNFRP